MNIFKKFSDKTYVAIFFGDYPDDIGATILPALDRECFFRYAVTTNMVVIRFTSKKSIRFINNLFLDRHPLTVFDLLIFESKNPSDHRLFDPSLVYLFSSTKERENISISTLKTSGMDTFLRFYKNRLFDLTSKLQEYEDFDMNNYDYDSDYNLDEEDSDLPIEHKIDNILEKIKVKGIESLNEVEKKILNSYGKNRK
jgi:hypothetical protein